jgi:hypothetical protein
MMYRFNGAGRLTLDFLARLPGNKKREFLTRLGFSELR